MGRKKVVYLALDERPCNFNFPKFLYEESKLEIISPDIEIMGKNKKPANIEKIIEFLLKEASNADGLVISIDTLIYGGIVPSRIHHLSIEELSNRLSVLKEIKKLNPKLVIYAFSLIMRCPQYSLSVEEPDYYDECGYEIFRKGFLEHKEKLGIISEVEKEELSKIEIKKEYLEDYLTRRKINSSLNLKVIDFVKKKVIDFLIFPQDDAAEYGYTAMDQEVVRSKIYEKKLHLKILMYPGADEVGLVLLSRIQNHFENKKPKVYIKYPAITSGMLIPTLEDRYLDTSIKYQIIASGGMVVSSVDEAEIILVVSTSANKMINSPNQAKPRDLSVLANYVEMFEFIKYYVDKLPLMIADVTYLNGGDLLLLNDLVNEKIEFKLAGYAGWNTAANTLGTVISQGFNYLINGETSSHLNFLALRYIEDIGYCSVVRSSVTNELSKYGANYFDVSMCLELIEELVKTRLNEFVDSYFKGKKPILKKVKLPWKRMFEVELEIKL